MRRVPFWKSALLLEENSACLILTLSSLMDEKKRMVWTHFQLPTLGLTCWLESRQFSLFPDFFSTFSSMDGCRALCALLPCLLGRTYMPCTPYRFWPLSGRCKMAVVQWFIFAVRQRFFPFVRVSESDRNITFWGRNSLRVRVQCHNKRGLWNLR